MASGLTPPDTFVYATPERHRSRGDGVPAGSEPRPDAVAAAASQEAGLERRGPDYAVVRPGESAQRLADDLATSVPLGIGPAVGYLPVVSVPTVDVRA